MVDFDAHFTWKVLSLKVVHISIACQSEHSLCYFYLSLEFPHAASVSGYLS